MTKSSMVKGIFSIALVIACIWWLSISPPSQAPQQDSKVAVVRNPDTSSATSPVNLPPNDDKPLTHDETIAAYSNYIGALQAQLLSAQMMDQVYFSKIKQSLQFNDLAGYRTNAENLKDALKKSQSDLWQRQTQLNIRDADMEPFNNAQSAASDLIGSYLSVAVDIAVNANTGMDSPPDDAQDVSAVKASERKFRSAALSGYDHFGVKRSDIDMDFLTLKDRTPASK